MDTSTNSVMYVHKWTPPIQYSKQQVGAISSTVYRKNAQRCEREQRPPRDSMLCKKFYTLWDQLIHKHIHGPLEPRCISFLFQAATCGMTRSATVQTSNVPVHHPWSDDDMVSTSKHKQQLQVSRSPSEMAVLQLLTRPSWTHPKSSSTAALSSTTEITSRASLLVDEANRTHKHAPIVAIEHNSQYLKLAASC